MGEPSFSQRWNESARDHRRRVSASNLDRALKRLDEYHSDVMLEHGYHGESDTWERLAYGVLEAHHENEQAHGRKGLW